MTDSAFSRQATDLVNENRHLHTKCESQENTIALLQNQYDDLADSVDGMKDRHERECHQLRTERDRALRAYTQMDGLLAQTADLIMQAARARKGDLTPETIPERPTFHIEDGRLPAPHLSS